MPSNLASRTMLSAQLSFLLPFQGLMKLLRGVAYGSCVPFHEGNTFLLRCSSFVSAFCSACFVGGVAGWFCLVCVSCNAGLDVLDVWPFLLVLVFFFFLCDLSALRILLPSFLPVLGLLFMMCASFSFCFFLLGSSLLRVLFCLFSVFEVCGDGRPGRVLLQGRLRQGRQ